MLLSSWKADQNEPGREPGLFGSAFAVGPQTGRIQMDDNDRSKNRSARPHGGKRPDGTKRKFGDKPAAKATVVTVDPATCESCHGTLGDMAAKTAGSTVLTDDNGTTVNPHERPAGEKHDENPATCTDCHNNHSKDLGKDAKKYCAQCHHRGVYECGTCHELRERSAK